VEVEDPFVGCGVLPHASVEVLLGAVSGVHVQACAVLDFLAIDACAILLIRFELRLTADRAARSAHREVPPSTCILLLLWERLVENS